MGKVTGFLEYDRVENKTISPKTRVKNFNDGKIFFPHTLNGSSLAIGRILIAIIENFQNENGFINIPEVLHKYMNGISQIKG